MGDKSKFSYTKTFYFYTANAITDILNQSEYKDSYEWHRTYIPDNKPALIKSDNKFEDCLVKKGIYYFAYIKFFIDKGEKYGIVAGKTKSGLVNPRRGSDVDFTKDLKYAPKTKWNAKEFLTSNKLEWYKDEILVVIPNQSAVESEAKKVERWLQINLQLFSS